MKPLARHWYLVCVLPFAKLQNYTHARLHKDQVGNYNLRGTSYHVLGYSQFRSDSRIDMMLPIKNEDEGHASQACSRQMANQVQAYWPSPSHRLTR